MSNLIVYQCEFGCGIIGIFDLRTQKIHGEDLNKHYKKCKAYKKRMKEMNINQLKGGIK